MRTGSSLDAVPESRKGVLFEAIALVLIGKGRHRFRVGISSKETYRAGDAVARERGIAAVQLELRGYGRQGNQGFLERTGLVLPSEAQWEYACRAGTSGPFAGTGNLDDMGWYNVNSGRLPHDVGTKQANDFGLHDMHGNVFEWCRDVYDGAFYGSDFAYGPDPSSTGGSVLRVSRGGFFRVHARYARSALRDGIIPALRSDFFGFRPARPLP